MRATIPIADQILSSGTNFLLAVLVARMTTPREFGVFALVIALHIFVIGVVRALCSEPLMVRHTSADAAAIPDSIAASTGTALAVGLVSAIGCIGAAAFLRGSLASAFVVLGAALPGLSLQEAWRHVFFATDRPNAALFNDAVWGIAQIGGIIAAGVLGFSSIDVLVSVWGFSGCMAAIVGGLQAATLPRLKATRRWLRSNRDLASRYLGEYVSLNGSLQASLYAVGAISGLATLGALRAGQVIFGPLTVAFTSAVVVGLREGTRLLAQGRSDALIRLTRTISAVLVLVAASWGFVALSVSDETGIRLFGANWLPAQAVIPALMIAKVCEASGLGAHIGMRVTTKSRRNFQVRIALAIMLFIGAAVGAAFGDARGAAQGMAVATGVGAVLFWSAFKGIGEATDRRGRALVMKSELDAP